MYYIEGKKSEGWRERTIGIDDPVIVRQLYEEMIISEEYVSVETNLPTIEGVWFNGNQSIH